MSYSSLIAETVKFVGRDDDSGQAYYARPTRDGKFPGVVVVHHLPGWDEWITEVIRNFALHGYAAIPPICTSAVVRAVRMTSVRRCGPRGGVANDQVAGRRRRTYGTCDLAQNTLSGTRGCSKKCARELLLRDGPVTYSCNPGRMTASGHLYPCCRAAGCAVRSRLSL